MPTISDTFNRADGGLGTTSDGTATWSVPSGGWAVTSNQAAATTSASAGNIAYISTGSADGTVTCTLTAFSDDGPMGRYSDVNNFFFVDGSAGTNASLLIRVQGGSHVAIGGFFTIPANAVLDLIFAGTSVSLKVNGTVVASGTSSLNQTSDKMGMYGGGTAARLDDWSFTYTIPAAARRAALYIVRAAIRRASVI